MRYTPRQWRVAFPIVSVVLLALAAALILALQQGRLWAAALAAGGIAGLLVSIAWALRHFAPNISAAVVGAGAVPAALLCLMSPGAALGATGVAAAVFAVWFAIYDLGVTARANRAVVSDVATIATANRPSRALIVYHSTRGGFQPLVLRAFAGGLASQGWGVEMTTASGATPVDLSPYQLLVLGAPSYNWQPARPVLTYLERLGDLQGKPVALVVSGGGMTDRALKTLCDRVARAHGRVVDAIEIWTSRPNAPRNGATDPQVILRDAGTRVAAALGPIRQGESDRSRHMDGAGPLPELPGERA
ncbi:MAG TPA: hypothetical protein VLV16_13055 [Gemmatimonadales bacterium]|nr:hypothetical protein [Gemmatimonadales bacterium]